ncbi:hypothetical protein ACWGKA_36435, partial [Streptomyces luteogriseus]
MGCTAGAGCSAGMVCSGGTVCSASAGVGTATGCGGVVWLVSAVPSTVTSAVPSAVTTGATPRSRLVQSEEELLDAVGDLGLPVVVKPYDFG